MTTQRGIRKSVSFVSMLLANFAVVWGFFVLPIYTVGFGMLLPYQRSGQPSAFAGSYLPLELPLIGVVLAVLGVLTAGEEARHRWTIPALLGLVLNAVPLALAVLLWIIRAGG